jgi:hypothetical protein
MSCATRCAASQSPFASCQRVRSSGERPSGALASFTVA